ncbi:MAG: glycosyltransferase family 1 protein [Treponema sp.]|nr:glycosyltransferase family 1 protein [Treponema sp.]
MKIGIDTFACNHGRSGLGSYLMSLAGHLVSDEEIQFEFFGTEIDRFTYTSENQLPFKSVDVMDSLTSELTWHLFKVNKFAKKMNYDGVIYAAGARMMPGKFKVPGITIVNDIVSSYFKSHSKGMLFRQLKKGLNNVNCIIVPSKFVKDDLISFGISADKIKIVHNGIDHKIFYPKSELSHENSIVDIKPFAIKKPYIIYASSMQSAEKKHVELIKAFTLFKEKTHLPHRLVIAGSEGLASEEIHKAAFASSAACDIFITGYFPHENFPELYREAEACVFPSVNEGAGLSVLEAMATGIPVACSNSGALQEIAGNNALFFDSDNIEDIADALEKVLTDEECRKNLVTSALKWTEQFSWKKTVNEIVEIVKSVVKGSSSR